jgi:outer membrane autotransporter protein/uncharacterized repeat protein (TIGR01451 family)
MKKNVLLIIIVLGWINSVQAINLGVINANVNPTSLVAGNVFTVNTDVINSSDTFNPESSNTISVTIDNFGLDPNANFTNLANVTGSWTCTPSGMPITSVTCTQVFSLPADDMTLLPLGFDLMAGSMPISIVDFNFTVTDTILSQDPISTIDTATVNTTVIPGGLIPDLDFVDAVTVGPYTATEGQSIPFLIDYQVTNLGGDTVGGASFSIFYDDQIFTYDAGSSTVPGTWNCFGGTSSVDCFTNSLIEVTNGALLDFQMAFLPSGFNGNAPASVTPYTFSPTLFTMNDSNSANDSITASVTISAVGLQTDLELQKFTKDFVGGSIITNIPVDTQFEYSIHVNNLSATVATNVVVADNIPVGIEITSAAQSTGSWNCVIAPFVDVNTSQLVTCTHPSIAASQPNFNEIINLDAFGRVSGGGPITNTASVTANEVDSNPSNDMDFADITVDAPPPPIDVFVTNTFDSGFFFGKAGVTVEQDQQATYKVLADASLGVSPLKNINNKPFGNGAVNVVLTDVLPAGITYVSHQVVGPNFSCAFDGVDTVSCTAPNLPETVAEDGVLITVLADGSIGSMIDNVATITADPGSNSILSNDSASPGSFTIIGPAVELDLTITKDAQLVGGSSSNNNFLIGQSFEYRLVAINQNGNIAQAGDVVIFDALPFDMNLDSSPVGSGWNCSGGTPQAQSPKTRSGTKGSGPIVNCINTVPIAANGGSLELIIPVSSQVTGTYTNFADVSVNFLSNAFETFTSDNSDSFNINVVNAFAPTTLAVTKDALVSGSTVTSVNSGSNYTYRIDVTNTGNADAINIVAVDTIPVGLNVTSTNGTGWNCSNIGQQYTCTYPGPLLPGANSFVDLEVTEATSIGTSQIINNVTVTAANATVPQSAINTVNIIRPNINIAISQDPDPVEANMPFDLIVAITNSGNNNLSSILVDNVLPSGFSYAISAKAAAPNCNQNGLIMSCFYSTPIAPGATELLTIPIQAISTVIPGANYINQTTISGIGIANPIVNTTLFNVMPSIIQQFDVSISKSTNMASVEPNGPFNYRLSVANVGTDTVTGVTVVDNLPTGIELASINSTGWSCTGTTQVSCTLASLPTGVVSDIILNVFAPSQEGVINNTAQVSLAEQDSNSLNNNSTVSINVINGAQTGPAIADLELTKTTSSPTLISGEQYSWVIEVVNNGPDVANNIVISDLIPEGFELELVTVSNGVCQNTLTDITCQIPFIFNQDSVSIEVLGTASIDTGELTSTATVVADSIDPVPGNNSGSVNVIVNPVPFFETDLAVSIDAGDSIDQGEVSEFVINVVNNGPDPANPPDLNIAVTGLIDSIAFNQGNDWSCQETGLVVSCQFNGTLIDNGQMSSVGITVNTTEVVLDAQDVTVTATVTATETDVDSILDNNVATSIVGVSGTPTEGDIEGALRNALGGDLGSTGDPILDNAIDAVSGYCEVSYFTALEGLCDSLYNAALGGDRDAVDRFLRQITPNQVIGQSTSVAEIAGAQFRNIGSRLNQLRGGGGSGFSTAGLNARYGNGSIPLGMLAYLNQTDEETDGLSKIPDDFITPWGFFVNGSISMGKRDATGKELGFDFDTYGLTAGFDYRLDARKVIGIALGYANFDSNVDGAAKLKSTGVTLTGYGSFYVNDNFYVDARISYGKPKFDQSRNIDFTLGSTHIDRTATGNTNANQYSFAMSVGYSFYKQAWNITPNATLSYVKTNIDSFTETGAGDFNVIYSEQQWDSLTWSAGLKVSKAISMKKGVITPQFDFDYNYESKNNSQDIVAHFINAPSDQIFIIETDSPDRTYGSAGLGLVYISANGKQAYINYRSVLGLEGFSRGTFNLGARFEF